MHVASCTVPKADYRVVQYAVGTSDPNQIRQKDFIESRRSNYFVVSSPSEDKDFKDQRRVSMDASPLPLREVEPDPQTNGGAGIRLPIAASAGIANRAAAGPPAVREHHFRGTSQEPLKKMDSLPSRAPMHDSPTAQGSPVSPTIKQRLTAQRSPQVLGWVNE